MTEVPETLRVAYARKTEPRCVGTIVLHGRIYRCARHAVHHGIHDANTVHPHDDQAVRW